MRALVCVFGFLLVSVPQVIEAQELKLSGLEWYFKTEQERAVDQARVQDQIEAGCVENKVKFADTAALRGVVDGVGKWPRNVQKLLSLTAFTDDFQQAENAFEEALGTSSLTQLQRQIIENQRVLVAMQFEQNEVAADYLEKLLDEPNVPSAIMADRLFWKAILYVDAGATLDIWRNKVEHLLEQSWKADPSSFQTRVWRIISWIEAGSWSGVSNCHQMITDLSTRILDVSEASACPLMIGHITHVLDRHFNFRADGSVPPSKSQEAWLVFTTGLLSVVSGEKAVAAAARISLQNAAQISCTRQMVPEITALEIKY